MQNEINKLCATLIEIASEREQNPENDERWTVSEEMLLLMARNGGPEAADFLVRYLRKKDLPDAVVDVIAKALASCCGPCAAPPSLRIFTFSPTITVQVKEVDFVQGGLGWKVWGSALILSRRLLALMNDIQGKEVLELGSGCGLCGLLLPSLGAAKVVLTDHVPHILSNLCRNVSFLSVNANSNVENDSKSEHKEFDFLYTKVNSKDLYSCLIKVRMLDWIEDSEITSRGPTIDAQISSGLPRLNMGEKFDWIIGSDLLYDPKSLVALAGVIRNRLKTSESKALLVTPVRENYFLSEFLKEAYQIGLSAEVEQVEIEEWIACRVYSSYVQGIVQRDEGGTMCDMDSYEGGIVAIYMSLSAKTQF